MTLQEFQSWALEQGEVAKTDGTVPGQCVSLINQYCSKVLGFTAGAWGDAYQWGQASNTNVMAHFNLVKDLQPGDVVVYPAGWAGSAPGHIGIYAGNNQILEQNGHVANRVSLSHLEAGYYAILRSKSAPAQGGDMPATLDYVKGCYRVLLGRDVKSDTEAQQWLGQDPQKVFWAIATSGERKEAVTDFLDLLYRGMLMRPNGVDQTGLDSWYNIPFRNAIDQIYQSNEAKAVRAKYNS